MAFGFRNPFKKKHSNPEVDIYEDFGDEAIPEAVTDSIVEKPSPPKGTTIEPKVLMIAGVVLVSLVTFIVEMGFDDDEEKSAQQKAEEEYRKKKATVASNTVLDEAKNLPSNYSLVANKEKEKSKNIQTQPATIVSPNDPPITNNYNQRPIQGTPPGYSTSNIRISEAEREENAALKSGIRFGMNQKSEKASATNANMASTGDNASNAVNTSRVNSQPMSHQEEKNGFVERNRTSSNFYSKATLQAPISDYIIQAGTIIPGVMITGIDSDLPGQIMGQVRENVYDSTSGQHLLIPIGAKLIGNYDSRIVYGQERVLVAWSRIIFPNGMSLDLEGMSGTDNGGYAGFKDKVNRHEGRILKGVLLGSILTAGARIATGGSAEITYSSLVGQGIAENIAQAASQITERNMNIQPTLEIRTGYRFNIFVNKDFVLEPYQP